MDIDGAHLAQLYPSHILELAEDEMDDEDEFWRHRIAVPNQDVISLHSDGTDQVVFFVHDVVETCCGHGDGGVTVDFRLRA